jgi:RecB family exonuclease
MDDGPTDGPPGRRLPFVSVELSPDEAVELLESLQEWASEGADGRTDPEWHTHLADDAGNELTVAIRARHNVGESPPARPLGGA